MLDSSIVASYKKSRALNFIIDGRYRWVRHGLVILFILVTHFSPSTVTEENGGEINLQIILTKLVSVVILVTFFYINHCYLIPRFLMRNAILLYVISIIGFISFIFLLMLVMERIDLLFIDPSNEASLTWKDFLNLSMLLMIFIAAFSSLKLFKIWVVNLIHFKELENSSLTARLEQLKSQINPHFLFNTLNNINFLIDENPKLASTVLLKLSDILRNQIYISKEQNVELKMDIEVLKDILFLEEIRRDIFKIRLEIQPGLESIRVPPFLFITFIENVVKHGGYEVMDSGYHVEIVFEEKDRQLHFSCANSQKRNFNRADYGGLGLNNLRKRLEILFSERFKLEINNGDDVFSVFLSIPMEDYTDE